MADQVSGLAGYNFYLDDGAGNKTKRNTSPIAEGTNFVIDGLDSNTDYSNLIYVAPVDNAGNEGTLVAFTGLNAKTRSPTPDEDPMSSTDVAAIDAIMARCFAAGAGPGVSVAIISPKGYLTKSYGSGVSNDGHYRIASVTKPFTATAVLMAIDNGLLTLDDALEPYYPGVPNGPIITIKQMLMMRSGVYDYQLYPNLGLTFQLNRQSAMSVEQIMTYIKGGAPAFTPGTAFQYTDSNHYLLAKVLEAVDPTHRTYDQIVTQDIITPLGLTETYCPAITDFGVKAPADIGYDNGPLGLGLFGHRNITNQNPAYVWASGYIISTVADIAKWAKELRDGTLLSPESQQLRMTTFAEQPNAGAARFGLNFNGPPTYGYGLASIRVGSWYGHDGSWPGYDGCCMFEPSTGTVIAVSENWQTTSPHVLAAMTTVWYEIASYLYPTSTVYPGYGTGGPFAGGTATRLGAIKTAAAGITFDPSLNEHFPYTFPFGFAPEPLGAISTTLSPMGASMGGASFLPGLNHNFPYTLHFPLN